MVAGDASDGESLMMRFGSLFSGCGGMDGGLEAAGMSCAWQVEIDRARQSVLRHHWPDIPKHEDIKAIQEGDLDTVDLIAGGSPCQDLSVAGRGEGLDGERSGLFHQFVRIADSQPAAWILWENVPGAMSSNDGADFGIILRELSGFWPAKPAGGWRGSGFCVGPKRQLVWRVLDSQYFGVAQQRERVFIVAGPRDGRSPAEVLFEPESLSRHPPTSDEARARVASLLAGSAGVRGWRVGADEAAGGQITTGTLGCGYGARRGAAQMEQAAAGQFVATVAHTLTGEGHDASEDGTGRGTPLVAQTLRATGGNRSDPQTRNIVVTAPLTTRPYADHAAQEDRLVAYGGNRTGGERDITYRKAQKAHGPEDCESSPALDAGGHSARTAMAIALSADQAGGMKGGSGSGVRRLTPRIGECERLQGFPDDWTRWAEDGRELKDSPRYRMIGNAVTWPVARWIGERLRTHFEQEIR